MRYPFAGWNEGFTTSAPLAFLSIKGHRTYPAGDKATLDIIPVDLVASGLIMATAATIAGENELVYQLGSSDVNPLYMKRAVELLGLYKRRYFTRAQGQGRRQQAPQPRAVAHGAGRRVARALRPDVGAGVDVAGQDGATKLIDELTPRWGAPRLQGIAEHMKTRLDQVSSLAKQTNDLFQLFMPFIYEREYVFRCDNIRALYARLTPHDRALLRWDPERDLVAPLLARRAHARPREVDLSQPRGGVQGAAEVGLHLSRPARDVRGDDQAPSPPDGDAPLCPTASDASSSRIATPTPICRTWPIASPRCCASAACGAGDKVMLLSENRPEWGITYFGILKAGGVVVPVDWQSSGDEVQNLRRLGARARASSSATRCASA